MDIEAYRVKGTRKLEQWATDDDGGLTKEQAPEILEGLQSELAEWQERLYAETQQSLLVVLQARDAAGKDGTVRRVMGAFNPAGVRVSSFKAPSSLELAHDFLWRVHAQVPRKGEIAVFNRSHYEDVLVTRVNEWISVKEAQRRLEHIRNFEALLLDSGTKIIKIYLHISKDEQKQRLQDRLDDPHKHWKFNVGDLKDRANWDLFTEAYEDAFSTSTEDAPWYVVPADRKWYRDLVVSQIILDTLKAMQPEYPTVELDAKNIVID